MAPAMANLGSLNLSMPVPLNLIGGLFAENAIRPQEEDDDKNDEGNPLTQERIVGSGAGLGDAHDEGAQHGSRNVADTAQHRGDEGLEARQDAHVGLDA